MNVSGSPTPLMVSECPFLQTFWNVEANGHRFLLRGGYFGVCVWQRDYRTPPPRRWPHGFLKRIRYGQLRNFVDRCHHGSTPCTSIVALLAQVLCRFLGRFRCIPMLFVVLAASCPFLQQWRPVCPPGGASGHFLCVCGHGLHTHHVEYRLYMMLF